MSEDLEREVIAMAARGLMPIEAVECMPDDAFTGAPRLLAWTCVVHALRCRTRVDQVESVGPLGAQEFLARCPTSLHAFAAERLAQPVFETAKEAKRHLIENLRRMRINRRPRPAPGPFHAVRLALATMPRLDLPLDVWTELQRDTRRELDLCEALDTFDPSAPERLATTTPKQEDERT